MSICPTCQPVKCCTDTLFSYTVTGGTVFYSAETSVINECPPSSTCVPGVYTIARGRIQFMVDLNGQPSFLSLQCCQSLLTRLVPAGSTPEEIAVIAQEMVDACAVQLAQCAAAEGVQENAPVVIPTPLVPVVPPYVPPTPEPEPDPGPGPGPSPTPACTDSIPADAAIPRYLNTTLVPDYHSPAGSNIAPYARPNYSVSIPGCGYAPSCGGVGQPGCGVWPEPIPVNTFALSGTVDLSVAKKRGFKNVQARKQWHGRWGYNSSNWLAPDLLDVFPDSTPQAKGEILSDCRSYVPTPDQNHYRQLNVGGQILVTGDTLNEHGGARTVDALSVMTVDKNSGVRTGTGTYPSMSVVGDAALMNDIMAKSALDSNSVYELFKVVINNHCQTGDLGNLLTIDNTGSEYSWTWAWPSGNARKVIIIDPIAGSFLDESWDYDDPEDPASELMEHGYDAYSLSETSLDYVSFFESNYEPSPYVQQLTCSAVLLSPYSGSDLHSDITSLLNQWNLTDDAKYPWRTDSQVTQAPLVTRQEVQTAVEPILITTNGAYVDSNAANYTGDLMGAPLPAGYRAPFDFRFENWEKCGGSTWYTQSFGGLPPNFLPQNATHWTNNDEANQWATAGGWEVHFPGFRVAQKWAEIKELRPSHNYFRPCGEDMFALDVANTRCVVLAVGSPVVVTVTESPSIITGDLCIAAGLGVSDGLYTVTKLTANTFRLTTLVLALPAGYPTSDRIFGKSRFPSAWSVCGQIKVLGATNTSPIQILLEDAAPYLKTGKSVVVSGVGGNTAANGTFVWTRISDTIGTLGGSIGNGAFTTSGWMKESGAPDPVWNTDASNGTYTVQKWGFNRRDIGEWNRITDAGYDPEFSEPRPGQQANGMDQGVDSYTCSQSALVSAVCAPKVICISPNGETFTVGATTDFGSVLADDIYGNQWQSLVIQSVNDPLWEVPFKPCGFTGTWSMDSGLCQTDTAFIRYYPVPLQVEARCAPPAGAPALPSGFYVGWLALPAYEAAPPISGNKSVPPVSLPTGNGSTPISNPTAWSIAVNQEICVCISGVFAAEYEADGVTCNTD